MDTKYPNTRDIEVSFVTTAEELHRMIQVLYGLDDYHWRNFADHPKRTETQREIRPTSDDDIDLVFEEFAEQRTILQAENTLLAHFISTSHKVVYYTYDYEVCTQWKISYK